MAHWSPENATRAYLRTIKMGQKGKEPDVAEFISALAGGNNAQLMVEVCGSTAGPTTMGLVAAAQQTNGHVVCILPGPKEVELSKSKLSNYLDCIEFVVGDGGDPLTLLTKGYKKPDFMIINCNIKNHNAIFRAIHKVTRVHNEEGGLIVGYNALHMMPSWNGLKGYFLPIGEGLLVCKVPKKDDLRGNNGRRSKWVVKVDKCTGEEHVFRVTCPSQNVIHV